ncbi:MAG: RsiV family protein [Candidatus Paceibacterota bacterium]|jgi:hypothetical protein|nr:RsiV family protein [bacterium]
MKRKNEGNKGLFFILFILFIVVIFCFYNQGWFDFGGSKKEAIVLEKKVESPILKEYKIEVGKINEKVNGASIDAEYPIFNNESVDKEVKLFIDGKIKDFKDSFSAGLDIDSTDQFLNISYESNKYTRNIFSIKFSIIYGGGIHPIEDVDCRTYNLDTSREIKLKDVFKENSGYLNKISGLVYSELMKNDGADSAWVSDGVTPKEENFSKFVLKDDSIFFYFSPGVVASNIAGVKEVRLSLITVKLFLSNLLDQ